MLKKLLPFLIIYIFVIVLYCPALSTFFSHDDFFHFKVSLTDGSFGQFIKFFGFYPFEQRQIAFYRPLFREVLYNSFYYLFGLNQIPFRLLSFSIHFINIYLVFSFMQKLLNKKVISYFTSFFFGVTAANVAPFYYLAGGIQTQGATMLILLTLISFIKYLKSKRSKYFSFTLITFILALASHEQSAIIPILLSGLVFLKLKTNRLKKIIKLWPLFLTLAIYVYLNISVIGYSSTETQYQMIFNFKTTIQTLAWYGVCALGLPETFVDYLLPGFGLNPNLMRYWGNYYRIIFPMFFLAILVISILTLNLFLKSKKVFVNKNFLFFLIWFPLGILPVLFLPQHKSSHYLYPSLPAFWGTLGYIIFTGYQKLTNSHPNFSRFFLVSLLTSLALLSITSAILGRTTYWAATRGKIAGRLVQLVKSKYPSLPQGSAIYFTNDPNYPFISEDWGGTSKQAYFALNGEDALQLLYNDSSLRVYYEDLGGVPVNFPEEKIYTLIAQI